MESGNSIWLYAILLCVFATFFRGFKNMQNFAIFQNAHETKNSIQNKSSLFAPVEN
jgi:hypothetical protein